MNILVVDASVAIKWFVPEVHSAEAIRWRNGPDEFHVPAVFFELEFANILWKKIRRTEITRLEADEIFVELAVLPLIRHPESPLILPAFELADRYQRSVYDALYVALADQLNGRMLTADQRLINALAGTPISSLVRHVTDSPP